MTRKQGQWKIKDVRNWLLSELLQIYDKHGEDACMSFDPAREQEWIDACRPPFKLIKAVAKQLAEGFNLVEVYGETIRGHFSVKLTSQGYAYLKEQLEEQIELEISQKRREIGFEP
jgi:hypothetical protein